MKPRGSERDADGAWRGQTRVSRVEDSGVAMRAFEGSGVDGCARECARERACIGVGVCVGARTRCSEEPGVTALAFSLRECGAETWRRGLAKKPKVTNPRPILRTLPLDGKWSVIGLRCRHEGNGQTKRRASPVQPHLLECSHDSPSARRRSCFSFLAPATRRPVVCAGTGRYAGALPSSIRRPRRRPRTRRQAIVGAAYVRERTR